MSYGSSSFIIALASTGKNDVVGLLVHLPNHSQDSHTLIALLSLPPGATHKMTPVAALKGSFIRFYVNGNCQGDAFTDLGKGNFTLFYV